MGKRWRRWRRRESGSDAGPIAFVLLVALALIFKFANDYPAVFGTFVLGIAGLTFYLYRLRRPPGKSWSEETRPEVPAPKPLTPLVGDSKSAPSPAPSSSQAMPYQSRGSLLSRGEHALYDVLVDVAAPGQIVLAKVRLADVVEVTARGSERMSWLARVIQKHVDFVVCEEKTLRILLVIELDDRSHADPDRQERDSFVDDVLAAAGIPIHHVRAQRAYDVEELRELLATFSATAIEGRMRSSR